MRTSKLNRLYLHSNTGFLSIILSAFVGWSLFHCALKLFFFTREPKCMHMHAWAAAGLYLACSHDIVPVNHILVAPVMQSSDGKVLEYLESSQSVLKRSNKGLMRLRSRRSPIAFTIDSART